MYIFLILLFYVVVSVYAASEHEIIQSYVQTVMRLKGDQAREEEILILDSITKYAATKANSKVEKERLLKKLEYATKEENQQLK
jgi:hypothetical protein